MKPKFHLCISMWRGIVALMLFSFFLPSLCFSQQLIPLDHWRYIPKTTDEAMEQLVWANRILANEGVLDALGHVSVRNPQNPKTFFQTRGLSPYLITKKDILEIDLESNVLTKSANRPYSERVVHAALLKARPDMNAVFHGHIPAVIPFSVTGVPLRPVTHVGSFLGQGAPVYDEFEPGDGMLILKNSEGERMARHLGNRRVQLLRGHGCNIVAEGPMHLVACAIYLRDNATIQWQALLIGKEPKSLTEEEAKPAMDRGLFQPLSRMWGYWTERVRRNMPDMADFPDHYSMK
jgi:3-hydroxy-2-methylpyridine-4,5-dicarboxylate 4-decarboxylase